MLSPLQRFTQETMKCFAEPTECYCLAVSNRGLKLPIAYPGNPTAGGGGLQQQHLDKAEWCRCSLLPKLLLANCSLIISKKNKMNTEEISFKRTKQSRIISYQPQRSKAMQTFAWLQDLNMLDVSASLNRICIYQEIPETPPEGP